LPDSDTATPLTLTCNRAR